MTFHGRRLAGLQGFLPEQSSTPLFAEQVVDTPVSRGLQGFRPGQGSSSSLSPAGVQERADEPGFSHFSRDKKKVRRSVLAPGRTGRALELIHAGRLRRG